MSNFSKIAIIIVILAGCLLDPFGRRKCIASEMTKWKYKLIKEGYRVKCTEKYKVTTTSHTEGDCITHNWIKNRKTTKTKKK